MRRGANVGSETREIPPLSIRADVVPATLDEEARTVELVFSTGAAVERVEWWSGKRFIEKLSLKAEHIRLERLNSGGPLLDAHNAWSVADQIGTVVPGSVKLTAKEARALVQFSKREAVEPIWQDVRDGILRNVSVGYRVHKFEETAGTEAKPTVRLATDWEPYEISMVPMNADPRAQVRSDKPEHTNPCLFVRAAGAETPDVIEQQTDADRARRLRLAQAQSR